MGAVTAVRAIGFGRSLERREFGHIVATPSARGVGCLEHVSVEL